MGVGGTIQWHGGGWVKAWMSEEPTRPVISLSACQCLIGHPSPSSPIRVEPYN